MGLGFTIGGLLMISAVWAGKILFAFSALVLLTGMVYLVVGGIAALFGAPEMLQLQVL